MAVRIIPRLDIKGPNLVKASIWKSAEDQSRHTFQEAHSLYNVKDINNSLLEAPSPDWLDRYFGKTVIYLDSSYDLDIKSCLAVDEPAYGKYKSDFIKKKGSADQPRWQIVANFIKGMGR